jgi:iron complex transport system substrate-binding protein
MHIPIRRRLGAALVALAAAAALAACGGGDAGAESGGTGGAFPRTIRHAMGTTEIETRPERVVVLDTAEAGAVTLVGVRPVGAVSVDPVKKTYPAHLADELAGVPDVGPLEEPNLDKIVALEPDLILSSKTRHEAVYDRLSEIAPVVFSEAPGEGWKANIGLFAKALGKEKEAAAAVAAYERRAQRIGAAIEEKNGGTMPTFSIVRFVDGPTRLYLPASFSGGVLAEAGLARPASQRAAGEVMTEIGPELIDRADGDYVFVATYGDPELTQTKAFTASPLWKRLDAVRKGRVTPVGDDTWMTGIGIQGAHLILDDIAEAAGVDAQR